MKVILFLDVDGVLSIPNPQDFEERKERWPGCGVPWPIPIAWPLLRAIDADPRLLPVWLSCWRTGCWEWNDRAGTRRWHVGYDLCKTVRTKALQHFPECRGQDEKLLAARWFLRERPRNRVVWIEDGFAKETQTWATIRGNVRLVNTWPMDGEAATFLSGHHQDRRQASLDFLAQYCGIERSLQNSGNLPE